MKTNLDLVPPLTGSIIEATMRPEDLIPRFAAVLKMLAPDNPLVAEAEALPRVPQWDETDESAHLCEALFYALEDHAGPGYRFGAHDDDGADYGFWSDGEYEMIHHNENAPDCINPLAVL